MICSACHAENPEIAQGCLSCGKSLYDLTRGSLFAGRYEVLGLLGKGGMGMVYKVHDRELDEVAALKILRPDVVQSEAMAKRFRSEIRLARKVRHKNVCGIHEYGQDGHVRYIAMEYVEGVDVRQVLQNRGHLSPDEALSVAIQVADGLQAVHEVGIVHRDLKTPNIMIDPRGLVRLMDFGIAKSFVDEGSTGATATGQIVGTPEYMSPEQIKGEKVDARSDIYALGIVVCELLTGDVPFRGDTPVATLFKHLQEPPLERSLSVPLPPPLVPILKKALAKARKDRYASVEDMRDALVAARKQLCPGSTARPAPIRGAVVPEPVPETEPLPTPVPTGAPTPIPTPVPTSEGASRPVPRRSISPWVVAVPLVMLAGFILAAALFLTRERASTASLAEPRAPTPLSSPPPTLAKTLAPPALARSSPAADSAQLSWAAVPGARSYRVTLSRTASLDPAVLDRRDVGGTTLQVPKLGPGTYYWRVGATGADGAEGLTTRVESFTILPPALDTARLAPSVRPSLSPVPTSMRLTLAEPSAAPSGVPATAAGTGMLKLAVVPWAEVAVDGTPVGTTPLRPISLPAGVHKVWLSNPAFQPLNKKVTIEPDKTTTLEVDLTFEAFPK